MPRLTVRLCAVLVVLFLVAEICVPYRAEAQTARVSMTVAVDASHATQQISHVRERIAVTPGLLTLEYPRRIPGEHMPAGPIVNVAGLTITAGTTPLRWARDRARRWHVPRDRHAVQRRPALPRARGNSRRAGRARRDSGSARSLSATPSRLCAL
jgi:hypothetical protein